MTHNFFSHKTRLQRIINGDDTDRTPIALWRHFPVDDQYPETLAKSILDYQNKFDFDLIKITPASSFCIKDWGVQDSWKGNTEGTREFLEPKFKNPNELFEIQALDTSATHLQNQLKALEIIVSNKDENTPVLQTIFSPLAQLKNLVGKENLPFYIRAYPDQVLKTLDVITQTTKKFLSKCISLKIDGVFYAVQHAQYSLLSVEEFRIFGKYFDLELLDITKSLWLNMIHLHGDHVMYDEILDYPCEILNWHDRKTQPDLKTGQDKWKKTVCGGLKQWETMAYGTPELVEDEAIDAIRSMSNKHLLLGTGCVMPIITPDANIWAAINVAKTYQITGGR